MVASEEEEIPWVFDLVSHEKADSLERKLASIDVVTQKEII